MLARAELLQAPLSANTVTLKTSPHWSCMSSQEVAEERQEVEGMLWFCVCARTVYLVAPAPACHDTFTVRASQLSTAVTLSGSQGAGKGQRLVQSFISAYLDILCCICIMMLPSKHLLVKFEGAVACILAREDNTRMRKISKLPESICKNRSI